MDKTNFIKIIETLDTNKIITFKIEYEDYSMPPKTSKIEFGGN